MQTQEINRIVQDLLQRGYEGTYWDYKEDYTDCKEDKLIDIICMANNIDGRDAYLIYGANDDGIVTGIENTTYTRYTTKSVTEFLRSKPFAGATDHERQGEVHRHPDQHGADIGADTAIYHQQ